MSQGVVKWFNNSKGYGFLTEDNGRDDIFAHFSSVEMEGYKTLKRGQHVEFEVIDGPKGLQAQNIRLGELNPQVSD
ncbi:MAG: cold-shock protein [Gammaproteobacteria bacterium]|nr:cold-shock protein [Gammaproteobacteria bacterium]